MSCTFKASTIYCLYQGKEGWVLRRFQQSRSYRDEIETRDREEIPFSSRKVLRGLIVVEDHTHPYTTLLFYIATRPTRLEIKWRLEHGNSRLGGRHCNY